MLAEDAVESVVVQGEAAEPASQGTVEAPVEPPAPPAPPAQPAASAQPIQPTAEAPAESPAPATGAAPMAQEEPTTPPPPEEEPTIVHRQSQEQLDLLEEMTLALEGLADVDDAFRLSLIHI